MLDISLYTRLDQNGPGAYRSMPYYCSLDSRAQRGSIFFYYFLFSELRCSFRVIKSIPFCLTNTLTIFPYEPCLITHLKLQQHRNLFFVCEQRETHHFHVRTKTADEHAEINCTKIDDVTRAIIISRIRFCTHTCSRGL